MIPLGVLLSASPVIGGGGGITIGLVIGLQLVIVALVLGGFAWYVRGRRPGWSSGARIGAVLSGLAGTVLLLAAILDPGGTAGTPLVNPVAQTVTSVDRGAVLYQANCARCHGVDGLGGGIDSDTTELPPPNLRNGHLDQHSDADLYTWISSGLPVGCRPGPVSCRRPTAGTWSTTSDRSTDTGRRPIRARRRVHRSWPGSASRACSPARCSAGSGSACAAVDRDEAAAREGPGKPPSHALSRGVPAGSRTAPLATGRPGAPAGRGRAARPASGPLGDGPPRPARRSPRAVARSRPGSTGRRSRATVSVRAARSTIGSVARSRSKSRIWSRSAAGSAVDARRTSMTVPASSSRPGVRLASRLLWLVTERHPSAIPDADRRHTGGSTH